MNTSPKKEPFISARNLAIAAAVSVTTTVLGSLLPFGTQGTLAGVALGPVLSGTITPVYDHLTGRAQRKLQQFSRRTLLIGGAALAATGCASAAAFTIVTEAASKQTLHSLITPGGHDHGSSFGNSSSSRTPSAPVATHSVLPTSTSSRSGSQSATVTAAPAPTSSSASTATNSPSPVPVSSSPITPSPVPSSTTAKPATTPPVIATTQSLNVGRSS